MKKNSWKLRVNKLGGLLFSGTLSAVLFSTYPAHAQHFVSQALLQSTSRDISAENLNFIATNIETSWKLLEANPSSRSFEAYYRLFEETSRIESISKAIELASLTEKSAISEIAASISARLAKSDIDGSTTGIAALKFLIELPDGDPHFTADISDLKMKYSLILDYVSSDKIGFYAVDLANKMSHSGQTESAFELYSDFMVDFTNEARDIGNKTALVEKIAASSRELADARLLSVLTRIALTTPAQMKPAIMASIMRQLGPNYHIIIDNSNFVGVQKILGDAWKTSLAIANHQPVERPLVESLDVTAASLDSRAFEILVCAIADPKARLDNAKLYIQRDIDNGKVLLAMQKAINNDVTFENSSALYSKIIQNLGDGGFAAIAEPQFDNILKSIESGAVKLDDLSTLALFSGFETSASEDEIRRLGAALPSLSGQIEASLLRKKIHTALNGSINHNLSNEMVNVGDLTNIPGSLQIAAALVMGTPSYGSSTLADESSRSDKALLQAVAERVWIVPSLQGNLLKIVSSDLPISIRASVALGASGNFLYNPTSGNGTRLAAAIRSLVAGAVDEPTKHILRASLGDSSGGIVAGDNIAKARLAVYDAVNRQDDLSINNIGNIDDAAQIPGIVAAAIFGNFHQNIIKLKEIVDYKQRVSALRKVAVGRAALLDKKGWLNSASIPEKTAATQLNEHEDLFFTDGRINLNTRLKGTDAAAKKPFLPNLDISSQTIRHNIPLPQSRSSGQALAGIAVRGETRDTRLTRFSSENYDKIVNLGVREYIYLSNKSSTPRIIYVTQGTMTIGELITQVSAFDPNAIVEEDGIVTVHVTIAINAGATLIVSGSEIRELRLSQDDGVFIVNSGNLYFDNVSVSAFNLKQNKPAILDDAAQGIYFRPFILGWSGSKIFASDSRFVALGYSGGRTYGMSLSSGPDDEILKMSKEAAPTGVFINNSFENLYYGFYAYEAQDIVFVGNELRNGLIYGLDPHDRSKNLMMAYNSTYDTRQKHGIIISREVDDSYIVGNLSFDNHGSGIMLDRASSGTIVYGNVASNNGGDGFAALESPCALVDSNMFANNGRTGIKIRNSWNIHIEGNQLVSNAGAGIESYIDRLESSKKSEFRNFVEDPYFPISTTSVYRNTIENNGTGISAHGASDTSIFANTFVNQLPHYLGGDLKPVALQAVTKSMDTPVNVRAACVPKMPETKKCSLVENGIIPAQADDSVYTSTQSDKGLCLKVDGSPQNQVYWATKG